MSWLANLQRHVVGQFHVLAGPQVFAFLRAVQAELRQIQVEGMRGVAVAARVEHGDGHGAALKMPRPHFDFAVGVDAAGLLAQRVLIDGDDVAIGEDGLDLRLHVGQVVAGQQRRGQHGPHGEVRSDSRPA